MTEKTKLITEDEFIQLAGEIFDTEKLRQVYVRLVELVGQGKLKEQDVVKYAKYRWCLCNPEAIIATEVDLIEYIVNNCNTAISENEAKVRINHEFGFEVSQITIIGTPYYEASDWQYITFECREFNWLWANANIYKVFLY